METVGTIWLCFLAADFISGFGHWLEDTYSLPTWPYLGPAIAVPNIRHHKYPRQMGIDFWHRNGLQIVVALHAVAVLAITNYLTWPVGLTLAIAACSNEFHAIAHGVTGNRLTDFLQEMGFIQSEEHHKYHHVKPFKTRFCVITNYLNPILDRIRFWSVLEWMVSLLGIPPKRCTEAREFV
jgi:hypothetical protein